MILPGPKMMPMVGGFTYEEVQSLPAMTSDSSPAGHVASSSTVADSNLPFKAFDQSSPILFSTSWTPEFRNVVNQWVQRTTPVPIRVWKYRIAYPNDAGTGIFAPKDFKLQGSANGTTWIDLDARTNQTGWSSSGETREFEIGASPAAFIHHRLLILNNNGSSDWIAIGELELLQAL